VQGDAEDADAPRCRSRRRTSGCPPARR
jgi:hypothetical protein